MILEVRKEKPSRYGKYFLSFEAPGEELEQDAETPVPKPNTRVINIKSSGHNVDFAKDEDVLNDEEPEEYNIDTTDNSVTPVEDGSDVTPVGDNSVTAMDDGSSITPIDDTTGGDNNGITPIEPNQVQPVDTGGVTPVDNNGGVEVTPLENPQPYEPGSDQFVQQINDTTNNIIDTDNQVDFAQDNGNGEPGMPANDDGIAPMDNPGGEDGGVTPVGDAGAGGGVTAVGNDGSVTPAGGDTGGVTPVDDTGAAGGGETATDANGNPVSTDGESDTSSPDTSTGGEGEDDFSSDADSLEDSGDTGSSDSSGDAGGEKKGPGLEYDSTRKYNLFKNFISIVTGLDNYIEKLESSMNDDFDYNKIVKLIIDKLREIRDITYDYVIMKFEISTYIQSLLFYQNQVVQIQLAFDILDKAKKKIKNMNDQK